MQVNRNKCVNNNWCSLPWLNLNHEHFNDMEGVYIIWHWGDNPAVVRVWQWIIKDRLSEHRKNPEIMMYDTTHGWCHVTWASVNVLYRDWIEKYLADTLNPLVWERFPDRTSIVVNLPR